MSSSKDDCALARPSNECVDDRLMESIKIHEDGCSTLEPSFGNTELDTDVETKTTSGEPSLACKCGVRHSQDALGELQI